jgi:pimeloyl-ACP methyl ester carboxylesterase
VRIVYLHGFASSPQSGKAQFFAARFAECGIPVEIPQLDEGDFPHLTITRQLGVIERTVAERPAILMGSSLGGYLAALFASRHQAVEKLILMAPAFQFPRRWRERYPTGEMAVWKNKGTWPIFHYGHGKEIPLAYRFVEDSEQYEDEPEFSQPAILFHGTHDPVVPAGVSEEYARRHSNVSLHLLDSGHELTDVMEAMWREIQRFLGLPAAHDSRHFQTS